MYTHNAFNDASTIYSIQSTVSTKRTVHQFTVVQSQIRISSITNCQSWLSFKGRTAKHYLNAFSNNSEDIQRLCTSLLTSLVYSTFHEPFWYWGDWKNIIQLTAMQPLSNSSVLSACAFNFSIQYLFFAKEMPKCSNTWSMKHFIKCIQKIIFCPLIMFLWFKTSLCFKNITY